MKKLPVFEALITDITEGIANISLVDCPAVESNFLVFKKQEPLKFEIEDEEQRIIYGVLMRADHLIYRYNEEFGEYYIKYSKDTIKTMAEKLLIDNKQNSVNIMHQDNSNVDGVNLFELFIKDTDNGISPKGFEDIEEGSLFGKFRVNNDDVWNAVKDGTFKGFSIEGFFEVKEQYKKINKKKTSMSKLKEKLKALLQEFMSIATDKGEMFYEGELAVGTEVFDDTDAPLANGEYIAEDKVYVVGDGKITEIRDKEVEEQPKTEEVNETVAEAFTKKCNEKFESYEERERKIAEAIRATGVEYFWLVEAGDDYAIVSIWIGDTEKFYRYDVTFVGEEAQVSNSTEVVSKFVPVEAPAVEEPKTEEPAQEPATEEQFEEQEPATEEPATEEPKEDNDIDTLKADVEALKAEVEALKENLKAIANTPAAEPIAEQFEAVTVKMTGDKKMDNLIRIASAKRN